MNLVLVFQLPATPRELYELARDGDSIVADYWHHEPGEPVGRDAWFRPQVGDRDAKLAEILIWHGGFQGRVNIPRGRGTDAVYSPRLSSVADAQDWCDAVLRDYEIELRDDRSR